MSHNCLHLFITQQSFIIPISWPEKITLAILSIKIILVPSVTCYKGKGHCNVHNATIVPLNISIRCKMCETLVVLLNQVFSFHLLLWLFKTSPQYLQVVWYFPPVVHHLWASWSHVSIVCVDLSDVYTCLSWTGQDILQQANTAHIINQAILKSVIYLLFWSQFPTQ